MLVIHAYRDQVVWRERDFVVAPDLDNAPLTGNNLIESPAIANLHGNYLIAYACFSGLLEKIDKTIGNGDQAFHRAPLEFKFDGGPQWYAKGDALSKPVRRR